MNAALCEARTGAAEGGIPIGAALVEGNRLVATGRNRRPQDSVATMHAEINCLYNASRKGVQSFRGMTMYTTLMPCHMCAGAIVQFGITRVVAGESSNFQEANGLGTLMRHGIEVIDLDMDDAGQLLSRFIKANPEQWYEDIGMPETKQFPNPRRGVFSDSPNRGVRVNLPTTSG